tara:strand:- start:49 stop:234 length:186 start_codon:yes stop_codon:yes gene_type:complete
MEIRTNVGTGFSVMPVEDIGMPKSAIYTFHGDLTDPYDLEMLASIIKKATLAGVDLDLSID